MRVLARFMAATVIAVAAACGGGDGNGGITEVASVAGTYSLKTVNGAPLPFVFLDESGYKLEITASGYTLSSAGTFSVTATFRETENGVVTTATETSTGTYSVNGSTVTFIDTDGETLAGTISGNTLQFSEDGVTAVYMR